VTQRLPPEAIDPDADKVVRRLARHGHKAYLVGGCVRDLSLGRKPKDFDVATSATPNDIKQLFRNCRIIGRRFRLAHIFFGGKIIETSTFRANPRADDDPDDVDELLIRRDNVFGNETEDARRRDFTVNGLFYDVEREQIIDHVEGIADLESRLIRTIGDPDVRFQEDPVRMLRAIKFAARLDFTIEDRTYEALLAQRSEIIKCAPPRLLEEVYRLLRGGAARRSMELLLETGLVDMLAPQLASMFAGDDRPGRGNSGDGEQADQAERPERRARPADPEEARWVETWADDDGAAEIPEPSELDLSFIGADQLAQRRELAWKILDQLDQLVTDGEHLSNALLVAAVASPFLGDELLESGVRASDANAMILEVLDPLVTQLRVARRDAERARQIILAQRRLVPSRRRRGRPATLAHRDYFDDALAVYEMTGRVCGRDVSDADQWRRLERPDGDGDDDPQRKRRRRRRGGRRRRRTPGDGSAVGDRDASDGAEGAAAGG
jgi:poly(A) polymerase